MQYNSVQDPHTNNLHIISQYMTCLKKRVRLTHCRCGTLVTCIVPKHSLHFAPELRHSLQAQCIFHSAQCTGVGCFAIFRHKFSTWCAPRVHQCEHWCYAPSILGSYAVPTVIVVDNVGAAHYELGYCTTTAVYCVPYMRDRIHSICAEHYCKLFWDTRKISKHAEYSNNVYSAPMCVITVRTISTQCT